MLSLRPHEGPLQIVCLAAHPDDVEIGCGGALLQLAGRGDVKGAWLTLTGSPERQVEARAAAEAFLPGATSRFAGLLDGRLPQVWGEVKSLLHDFAAEFAAPDVVFAPRVDDAHQDHRLIGRLAPTVWRDSLVVHYEIPKWDADLARPNIYVDVPEALARRKFELLDDCYASQRARDWWDEELFLGLMRVRGVECHTRYAEGFAVTKCLLGLGRS